MNEFREYSFKQVRALATLFVSTFVFGFLADARKDERSIKLPSGLKPRPVCCRRFAADHTILAVIPGFFCCNQPDPSAIG